MVSHSKCDVVVKIEMATDNDIHLKNSAKIKIYTSFLHNKKIPNITMKTEYMKKINLNRSQSMLSAVAVRIAYSIASNESPTTHRIKKIRFKFGCLSKIFSKKYLKKSNVKSQTKTSQSHPQSHIFQSLIKVLQSIIYW